MLSGARNLANFDEYRNAVFVRADESADVRRKKALDRCQGGTVSLALGSFARAKFNVRYCVRE